MGAVGFVAEIGKRGLNIPKPEAVTYCMNRPDRLRGMLCQNAIPLTEKVCSDCKKEIEAKRPMVMCHICNPPRSIPIEESEKHRKSHLVIA